MCQRGQEKSAVPELERSKHKTKNTKDCSAIKATKGVCGHHTRLPKKPFRKAYTKCQVVYMWATCPKPG